MSSKNRLNKLKTNLAAIGERIELNSLASEPTFSVFNEASDFRYSFGREPAHPFLVASITKIFTAIAMMRYSERKVLSLTDPLEKFLTTSELDGLLVRDGRNAAGEITLQQLLSNRSGLADYYKSKQLDPSSDIAKVTSLDPGWDFEDALSTAKILPDELEKVRKRASYSFTNYQILSEVIERVSGLSLAEVFKIEISDQIGLRNTQLLTKGNLEIFGQALPVRFGHQDYLGAARMASLRGEGALVSTTSDLITLLRSLNSGDLISSESVLAMRQPTYPLYPLVRYGTGIMKVQIPGLLSGSLGPAVLYGHLGATGSFAFWEQTTNTYITGTVNQMGDKTLGTKLLFKLAAQALRHL